MSTPDRRAIDLGERLQGRTKSWSGPNPRWEQARYRALAAGMATHRGGRRMAVASVVVGMLIGLSVIATATNGLVIPFTGITIGGLAGEPPGTANGPSRASSPQMSARSCLVRDPHSCVAPDNGAGAAAAGVPGSTAGGRAISAVGLANSTPPGGGSGRADGAHPADPPQSQGGGGGGRA